MAIEIGPLQVAAIASASLAVSLIAFVIIYRLFRRATRNRPSTSSHRRRSPSPTTPYSPSRTDVNRSSFTTFGFGPAQTVSGFPRTQTPIAPSPSTGQTTLVTPSTGGGMGYGKQKLKKGVLGGMGGKSPIEDPRRPQSEEMIVVTYEDGLRKLGIDPDGDRPRPHHILYPEDDDDPETMAAYDYERQQVQVQAVDSPRAIPGRGGAAGAGQGLGGKVPESTWLPSYYNSPHSGRGGGGTESELAYGGRI
ncbi:hypothetical protein IAT38_002884 [Cryptococcus sp. DSM 104549]